MIEFKKSNIDPYTIDIFKDGKHIGFFYKKLQIKKTVELTLEERIQILDRRNEE